MRTYYNHIVLAIIAVLMWSCDSGKDYDFFISKYYLEPAVTTVDIGGEYQSKAEFQINSDCSWRASSDKSWLNVTPAEGNGNATINLEVNNANPSVNTDQAIITITCVNDTKIKQTVTVKRKGTQSSISVEPESLEFESTGNAKSFTIRCNNAWKINAYRTDIIKSVSPLSADEGTTVTVELFNNSDATPRSTSLEIENIVSGAKITLPITQKAYEPALSLENDRLVFYTFGESAAKLEYLTSSDPWEIMGADNLLSWLHIDPTSGGNGVSAIKIWVDELTNQEADSVKVMFTNSANRSFALWVVRETILLEPREAAFDTSFAGAKTTIEVKSNHPWSISTSNDDWVTFDKTSGGVGTTYVTITAKSDNPDTSGPRIAYFALSCTDVTNISTRLTVIQPAKPLIPSPDDNTPPEINN